MNHLIHTRFGPLYIEAGHAWEALTILNRADAFVSYRAATRTLALNRAFWHARQCGVAND